MNFQISPLHEIYKRAIKFSKRCTSFSEPVESAFTTVCHVSETFSCPGNVGIAPGNGSFCIVVINIEQNRVEVDASSGCGLFYVGAADVLGLIRDPTGKQVHSLRNLKKIDLISHQTGKQVHSLHNFRKIDLIFDYDLNFSYLTRVTSSYHSYYLTFSNMKRTIHVSYLTDFVHDFLFIFHSQFECR